MFVITSEARDRQNAAIVAKASGPLTAMSEYADHQGPLASAPGVTLTSSTAGAPLASTFHDHAAGMTIEVQQAGYQEAADRGHALQQLAERRPFGLPGQPSDARRPDRGRCPVPAEHAAGRRPRWRDVPAGTIGGAY